VFVLGPGVSFDEGGLVARPVSPIGPYAGWAQPSVLAMLAMAIPAMKYLDAFMVFAPEKAARLH
jgi:hypothetical protein